jgi:hypothetical protein
MVMGLHRYALSLFSPLSHCSLHLLSRHGRASNERPRFMNSYLNFALFIVAVAPLATSLIVKAYSPTRETVQRHHRHLLAFASHF